MTPKFNNQAEKQKYYEDEYEKYKQTKAHKFYTSAPGLYSGLGFEFMFRSPEIRHKLLGITDKAKDAREDAINAGSKLTRHEVPHLSGTDPGSQIENVIQGSGALPIGAAYLGFRGLSNVSRQKRLAYERQYAKDLGWVGKSTRSIDMFGNANRLAYGLPLGLSMMGKGAGLNSHLYGGQSLYNLAGLGSLGGMAGFMGAAIGLSILKSFRLKKINPSMKDGGELVQQNSVASSYDSEITKLVSLKQIQPIDQIKISLFQQIERHTSVLPYIASLYDFNKQKDEKDPKKIQSTIKKETPDKLTLFDKSEKLLLTSINKYDPITQLLNFITTGSLPSKVLNDIESSYPEQETKVQREFIKLKAKQLGITTEQTRLLDTNSSSLILGTTSYQEMMVQLTRRMVDLSVLSANSLVAIKIGMGIDKNTSQLQAIKTQNVFTDMLDVLMKIPNSIDKFISNIPVVSSLYNLVKLPFELVSNIGETFTNTISSISDYIYNFKNNLKDKMSGGIFSLISDHVKFDQAMKIYKSDAEKANIWQSDGHPKAFMQLISYAELMSKYLRNIYFVLKEAHNVNIDDNDLKFKQPLEFDYTSRQFLSRDAIKNARETRKIDYAKDKLGGNFLLNIIKSGISGKSIDQIEEENAFKRLNLTGIDRDSLLQDNRTSDNIDRKNILDSKVTKNIIGASILGSLLTIPFAPLLGSIFGGLSILTSGKAAFDYDYKNREISENKRVKKIEDNYLESDFNERVNISSVLPTNDRNIQLTLINNNLILMNHLLKLNLPSMDKSLYYISTHLNDCCDELECPDCDKQTTISNFKFPKDEFKNAYADLKNKFKDLSLSFISDPIDKSKFIQDSVIPNPVDIIDSATTDTPKKSNRLFIPGLKRKSRKNLESNNIQDLVIPNPVDIIDSATTDTPKKSNRLFIPGLKRKSRNNLSDTTSDSSNSSSFFDKFKSFFNISSRNNNEIIPFKDKIYNLFKRKKEDNDSDEQKKQTFLLSNIWNIFKNKKENDSTETENGVFAKIMKWAKLGLGIGALATIFGFSDKGQDLLKSIGDQIMQIPKTSKTIFSGAGALIGFKVGGFGGALLGGFMGGVLTNILASSSDEYDKSAFGSLSKKIAESIIDSPGIGIGAMALVGAKVGLPFIPPIGMIAGALLGGAFGILLPTISDNEEKKVGFFNMLKDFIGGENGILTTLTGSIVGAGIVKMLMIKGAIAGAPFGGPVGIVAGALIGAGIGYLFSLLPEAIIAGTDGDGKTNFGKVLAHLVTDAIWNFFPTVEKIVRGIADLLLDAVIFMGKTVLEFFFELGHIFSSGIKNIYTRFYDYMPSWLQTVLPNPHNKATVDNIPNGKQIQTHYNNMSMNEFETSIPTPPSPPVPVGGFAIGGQINKINSLNNNEKIKFLVGEYQPEEIIISNNQIQIEPIDVINDKMQKFEIIKNNDNISRLKQRLMELSVLERNIVNNNSVDSSQINNSNSPIIIENNSNSAPVIQATNSSENSIDILLFGSIDKLFAYSLESLRSNTIDYAYGNN